MYPSAPESNETLLYFAVYHEDDDGIEYCTPRIYGRHVKFFCKKCGRYVTKEFGRLGHWHKCHWTTELAHPRQARPGALTKLVERKHERHYMRRVRQEDQSQNE